MEFLTDKKCVPCQKGAPVLTPAQMDELLPQIPEWAIIDTDTMPKLFRAFKFKDFKQALSFVNAVGDLAEDHFHHPTLILDWGKVQVFWTTHKIKGLHENDVIMAAKTDRLFSDLKL